MQELKLRVLHDAPKVRAPHLTVCIDATRRCNLGCTYCYYGTKGFEDMNPERIANAIIRLYGARPISNHVKTWYMGGEPTLAFDAILEANEHIDRALEHTGVRHSWGMTSNLASFNERMAHIMICQGATIHCSLDGPADIQNRNRPFRSGAPSYEAVTRNVKFALMVNPNDTARPTICPQDAERLLEIADFLFSFGFKQVGLFPAHGSNWTSERIEAWARALGDVYAKYPSRPTDEKKVTTFARHRGNTWHCGAGKGYFALTVQGQLTFCHHLTNTSCQIIDAANVTSEEIDAAIASSTLAPNVSGLPSSKCASCNVRDACAGGCWVENYCSTGDVWNALPAFCEIMHATLKALEPHSDRFDNISNCLIFHDDCDDECQSDCQFCEGCFYCHNTGP